MPGSTAYGGIKTLDPKKGETLYVSGAEGAVGSLVGEIGKKVYGLRVIGSCGGEAKTRRIVADHGYDVAIDRKTLPAWGEDGDRSESRRELGRRLKEAAPDGIDMYFDNVGCDHLEAAFDNLRPYGRIAICGALRVWLVERRVGGWAWGLRFGGEGKGMGKWNSVGLLAIPACAADGWLLLHTSSRLAPANPSAKDGVLGLPQWSRTIGRESLTCALSPASVRPSRPNCHVQRHHHQSAGHPAWQDDLHAAAHRGHPLPPLALRSARRLPQGRELLGRH
jgi:hypothetical protein